MGKIWGWGWGLALANLDRKADPVARTAGGGRGVILDPTEPEANSEHSLFSGAGLS